MKWLDRLLGHRESEADARDQDEAALTELRTSFKRVGARTDRLIAAYARAEKQRLARRKG